MPPQCCFSVGLRALPSCCFQTPATASCSHLLHVAAGCPPADDVATAMEDLDFGELVPPLRAALEGAIAACAVPCAQGVGTPLPVKSAAQHPQPGPANGLPLRINSPSAGTGPPGRRAAVRASALACRQRAAVAERCGVVSVPARPVVPSPACRVSSSSPAPNLPVQPTGWRTRRNPRSAQMPARSARRQTRAAASSRSRGSSKMAARRWRRMRQVTTRHEFTHGCTHLACFV